MLLLRIVMERVMSLSLKKYKTAKELVRTESGFKFFVLFGFAIRNA